MLAPRLAGEGIAAVEDVDRRDHLQGRVAHLPDDFLLRRDLDELGLILDAAVAGPVADDGVAVGEPV